MYITDKRAIKFVMECIKQLEPNRILDVGIALERMGIIGQEQIKWNGDVEIIIDAVLSDEIPLLNIYKTLYEIKSDVVEQTAQYDLAFVIKASSVFENGKLKDIISALSKNTKVIAFDEETYQKVSVVKKREVCIKVDEAKYYLIY